MKALKKNGLGGGLVAALLVMAVLGLVSLTGCASAPETLQIDNTTKIKYSASEFDSGDFYNDIFSSYFSFFTMERVEPVFFGFDGDIFKIMKNSIASGSATKEILSEENSESLKQSLSESLNKTIKRGRLFSLRIQRILKMRLSFLILYMTRNQIVLPHIHFGW